MDKSDYIEKIARCHCGIITLLVRFEKAKVPIQTYLCHCNTCRHVTGEMAFTYVPISGPPLIRGPDPKPVDPQSTDLTGYNVTPDSVRYFCNNCSSHIFSNTKGQWYAASVSVEDILEVACFDHHIWVADTLDGGMADHIREVNGIVLPRYSEQKGSKELPLHWRSDKLPSKEEAAAQKAVNGYCHCGKNRFYATRPNFLSGAFHAPYPDLLYPKEETRLATIRNPKDEKWWLFPRPRQASVSGRLDMQPSAEMKYLAGHCVCTQCRQAGGFMVHSFAYVPAINVFAAGDTRPVDLVNEINRPPGLKQYRSSTAFNREFCGTCGATVLWWDNRRPDILSISVGIVDEKDDGVRMDDWTQWHKRITYAKKAAANPMIDGLAEGVAAWVEENARVASPSASQN